MKYAIRLSHLPPVVIYATLKRSAEDVVAALCEEATEAKQCGMGICGYVNKVLRWLADDILCESCQLVEDDTRLVFTDTRDADYLITKTDKGFDVVRLTDSYDRELLGR